MVYVLRIICLFNMQFIGNALFETQFSNNVEHVFYASFLQAINLGKGSKRE